MPVLFTDACKILSHLSTAILPTGPLSLVTSSPLCCYLGSLLPPGLARLIPASGLLHLPFHLEHCSTTSPLYLGPYSDSTFLGGLP